MHLRKKGIAIASISQRVFCSHRLRDSWCSVELVFQQSVLHPGLCWIHRSDLWLYMARGLNKRFFVSTNKPWEHIMHHQSTGWWAEISLFSIQMGWGSPLTFASFFQEGWHTTSESVFFWMRHFVLSFYAYVAPKTSNYGTWLISFDWNYQGLLKTISKKAPSTRSPSGFLDQATWAKSLQSAIRPSETANGCGCQADPPWKPHWSAILGE